jgi:prophage maintenance system killer protein
MRYLTLAVELHRRLLQVSGGATGIRDLGALEAAVAQPKASFGGVDLYPTLAEKATALCNVALSAGALARRPTSTLSWAAVRGSYSIN